MTGLLFICRSMTHAQKMVRALERNGISASIVRPDIKITQGSCSNAVMISQGYLPEAVEILQNNKVPPVKIVLSETDGNYRELRF